MMGAWTRKWAKIDFGHLVIDQCPTSDRSVVDSDQSVKTRNHDLCFYVQLGFVFYKSG